MQDCFEIRGPNGVHECFVTELLGPNFARHRDMCCDNGRLPGKVAKKAAEQALLGLSYLHAQGIAHGGEFIREIRY
jgi:serine/threonine protein kinase